MDLEILSDNLQTQIAALVDSLDPLQQTELSNVLSMIVEELKPGHQWEQESRCYITLENCTETILGFGIFKKGRNLLTPGEFLSKTGFDMGCRISTAKTDKFEFWIPAFINKMHASHPGWETLVLDSLENISNTFRYEQSRILDVLPNIINSLIVEMMKGDRPKAQFYFEAICNLWRTLYHFVHERGYKSAAKERVESFCNSEKFRSKNQVPDLGTLLVLYTCLSDEIEEERFVDAYVDEQSLRRVMWWNGTCEANAEEVFLATKTGREILLFQLTFARILLGGDAKQCVELMDRTCCKLPERMKHFLQKVKEMNVSDFREYFEKVGCSEAYTEMRDVDRWVKKNVLRANRKGKRYRRRR